MIEHASEMAAFVRVVDAKGFSAAAPALGLTPSAVSKLVTRLGAGLGGRLPAPAAGSACAGDGRGQSPPPRPASFPPRPGAASWARPPRLSPRPAPGAARRM